MDCVEYQEYTTTKLEWTLRGLKHLFDSSKGESKSKVTKSVKFGGGRWQVLFYANSGHEGGGFVSLYLSCEPTMEEKECAINGRWAREGLFRFTFEISSLAKHSPPFNSKEASDHAFSYKTSNWGWAQFAKREAVYYSSPEVKTADAFVISCSITASPTPPTSTPASPRSSVPRTLMDAVGGMLDDPLYSDCEFIFPGTSGGRSRKPPKRIWAAKRILRRAEYFDTMFSSGFAEASTDDVNVRSVNDEGAFNDHESSVDFNPQFDDSDESDFGDTETDLNHDHDAPTSPNLQTLSPLRSIISNHPSATTTTAHTDTNHDTTRDPKRGRRGPTLDRTSFSSHTSAPPSAVSDSFLSSRTTAESDDESGGVLVSNHTFGGDSATTERTRGGPLVEDEEMGDPRNDADALEGGEDSETRDDHGVGRVAGVSEPESRRKGSREDGSGRRDRDGQTCEEERRVIRRKLSHTSSNESGVEGGNRDPPYRTNEGTIPIRPIPDEIRTGALGVDPRLSTAEAPVPGPQKSRIIVKDTAYVAYRACLYYLYTDSIVFAPLSSQFLHSSPSSGGTSGYTVSTSADASVSASVTHGTLSRPPLVHQSSVQPYGGFFSRSEREREREREKERDRENANGIGGMTRKEWILEWEAANPGRPRPCSAKTIYRLADKLDLKDLKQRAFQHIVKSLTVSNVPYEVFSSFSAAFEDVRKVQVDFLLANWSEIKGGEGMKNVIRQLRVGRHPGFEEVWPVLVESLVVKDKLSEAAADGNEGANSG